LVKADKINPSQNYGVSLAIWDHTDTHCYLPPDTSEHCPTLTLSSKAGILDFPTPEGHKAELTKAT